MPAEDSPAILVARFLRTNDYPKTLVAFLREAGLPPDAGSGSGKALTIERVLQEKKAYDLSVNFEKLGVDEKSTAWVVPAPTVPKILALPTSTNLLCISIESLLLPSNVLSPQQVLLSSTADRRLNMLSIQGTNFEIMHSHLNVQDSPILHYIVIKHRYLVCTSMSGKVVVFDSMTSKVIAERKDHSKYVVQVASFELDDGKLWLATAGWDGKVLVYLAEITPDGTFVINSPVASAPQPTSPEAVLFVRRPDDEKLYMLVSRRDLSFLYYYELPEPPASESEHTATLSVYGRQNLAPNSNAWVAFTPAALAPCPNDPTLIAVATSAVPHMKLIIVRLLFAPEPEAMRQIAADTTPSAGSLLDDASASHLPAARQARLALALQDREAAAIAIHCTTMAPQTQYSTPTLAWRPDGSGVWVNSDDGVVRGIEASTGKVITNLEGHEAGSKIRCLWAGYVEGTEESTERKECLLSGGFDQRLIAWW